MSEEILVNVTPRETRVAVIENGMLQELHIERGWRRGVVGNIYKGKVQRVMPGMQAAFVEVGLERAAFLHANDVVRLAPAPASVVDTEETPIPPPPAASVPIVELLRDGQDIVVQVVKDPIGTKGARLTTQISIPSRYLVLLPQSKIVGVSARIEDEAERLRLKTIVSEVSAQHGGFGYIIRTNAEGQPAEALAEDIAYLSRVWTVVERRGREAPPCSIIYEDLSLPLRAVRDLIRKDVEKVKVDSNETFVQLQAFVAKYMPVLAERLELYTGDRPIFDLYGVEDEIGRALNKQVPLKSGGYLVIDQTEAMTTIDVNTGSFVGQRNLEETVFRTNLEAAQAVARQLRLRNLGGIIIIDFIDMDDPEHRRQVLRTLEKALARDHAKTTVYEFSPLGLVEMTRKRTVESLERQLSETCGQCGGRGTIKTAETVTYEIFREITRAVRQFDAARLLVIASSKVVARITDEESAAVAELEEFLGKSIRFQSDDQYLQEQFDVVLL
ncbi:ribonuclease G [Xanthomonas vesicatoria]|uniref:Ribonuclease G n=3 Tax=Xanthomonas vesicatoria TaxID=56460 RepID=A0AAJ0J018_9XANT|nr:ribonuclease G [Xanthomonas vesicatoria]APO94448.1 ribonuclease E/G [Xanthomonas vesicatoria]APP74685.1 ribonuclease E/G [Xanthomonas vesicatoria ATCC 35937]EGD06967.1 RNAse G [Xanthomonas vesicatoria ATCC 35937]KHM95831.1 ribonuclease G [Xanthomonas vesicatoria]KHM96694.1 ribonuclease G [Xanthomonas vesicatoria]